MISLRVINLGYLKYLLPLALAVYLVACSGGDGGSAGSTGSALLSWVAPTERADNTPLVLSEIAGYRIYYGVKAGAYLGKIDINDSTATEFLVSGIPPGAYFIVLTTIDRDGLESVWSSPEVVASF